MIRFRRLLTFLQVAASNTPGGCPPNLACNNVSGFMVFIDESSSLYPVANWQKAAFSDRDSSQVKFSRRSMLQALSLVTTIGTSATTTTVAVNSKDGSPILLIDSSGLFNLTAPKQAGFIGQTIQPPYGSIPSLIYFLGTETQSSSYSVFAISTSPEVYSIRILQNPYIGSNNMPSRSSTTSSTSSIVRGSQVPDVQASESSRRSLLQQAPYQSLTLSSTCFEATLSRRPSGSTFTTIILNVYSYAGNVSCANIQVCACIVFTTAQ